MNWQVFVGTGVFVGTIVTLLYVGHRSVRISRPSRIARRVLTVLARDVGTAQSAYDVWQRVNVPRRRLSVIMSDLVARGLVEITDGPLPGEYYALTSLGVVASQRRVRGQHGRHR